MTLSIRRLDSADPGFAAQLRHLLAYSEETDEGVERAAQSILADVRVRGDAAVLEYTARFDGIKARSMSELRIPVERTHEALAGLPPAQRAALEAAADRIRAYHLRQVATSWRYTEADGTELGQNVTPLDRAGLYVPGGKAAYPSSLLMNAIPAKVAGVAELVMVSPAPGGHTNPMVLAAAAICKDERPAADLRDRAVDGAAGVDVAGVNARLGQGLSLHCKSSEGSDEGDGDLGGFHGDLRKGWLVGLRASS
jgi:histidinol dehydrogenase